MRRTLALLPIVLLLAACGTHAPATQARHFICQSAAGKPCVLSGILADLNPAMSPTA